MCTEFQFLPKEIARRAAQDARLAGTAIGQLLQARHSIAEEILDLRDDSNDYG
jgi:hypothetical protein